MKKIIAVSLLLIVSFALVSCEDSVELKSLKHETEVMRKKITNDFKQHSDMPFHLPKAVSYQSDTYSPNGLSNPAQQNTKDTNPLNAYPIKSYQFTGTLSQGDHIYAYLLGPDHTVYQVKEGDAIGNNYAKITKISDSEIEVIEKIQDEKKQVVERRVVLQLKD